MKFIGKILLFGLTFGLCCLVLDLFLNWGGIITPIWSYIDAKKGHTMVPDQRVVFFKEGFIMTKTNSAGYLGPAYPIEKEQGKIRVALVGNSYIQGFHLFERWHFAEVLRQQLEEKYPGKYEIMNFGQARFNLSDQYYYYENFVKDYQPDITLFFCRPVEIVVKFERMGPYYELKDGELAINRDFLDKGTYKLLKETDFLLRNSSIYRLGYLGYKNVESGKHWEILLDKFYVNPDATSGPAVKKGEHKNFEMSEIAGKLFEKISEVPNAYFVTVEEFSETNVKAIKDFGVNVLDLSEPLDELLEQGIDPNYWKVTNVSGHWNHEGQKAVADYLMEKITKTPIQK